MRLYHYRSIESALLEIEKGTFHFAAREELNDPLEGFVRVFWQGDQAAWEGLFRNYICSVSQAMEMYLLQGNEDILHHKTLIVNLNCFDKVPYGEVLKVLGDTFLADKEIQRFAEFYGGHRLKVREEELRLILRFIHRKALVLCAEVYRDRNMLPEEEAGSLLKQWDSLKGQPFPFDEMEKVILDEKQRRILSKVAEDFLEDAMEFQYIRLGFDDETFLYGKRSDENRGPVKENIITQARQHRNYITVVVDFPGVYVEQLKDMVYPESYVVCFSGKNDNSAMWGNYADNHRGVCLIYDTDEENRINMNIQGQKVSIEAKPVRYEGDPVERNFFETFGRLTMKEIAVWLTGRNGLSSCYDAFMEKQVWRDSYWEAYDIKTYRKIKAWEPENEYRLALTNTFYQFSKPESRNLLYNRSAFKGVIFGIKTSEYDKKRIVERLLAYAEELPDFTFYQAEYDDEEQKINIRKKALWKFAH